LLVPGVGVGGTGTQVGGYSTTAEVQASLDRQAANAAAGAAAAAERAAAAAAAAAAGAVGGGVGGSGVNGGTPWAPSVGIPDNFWGFAMMMIGMR